MEPLSIVFVLVALGIAGAAGVGWRSAHRVGRAHASRADDLAQQAAALELARAGLEKDLEAAHAEGRAERDKLEAVHAEQLIAQEQQRQQADRQHAKHLAQLDDKFKALAGDALARTRDELMKQATAYFEQRGEATAKDDQQRRESLERLVKPIRETLDKTQERLLKLDEQVGASGRASQSLQEETAKLVRALSRPEVRGRYGEVQLRRVAELAGMTGYCDFTEQAHTRDGEGAALRPDMLVRLPNERVVAVDAKANLDAYLAAIATDDPAEQAHHLDRFARHMAEQVDQLARKGYWSAFEGSPEFVVMFVPGDHFLDAALARRPDLLEKAFASNVILASPATLIGLLRAVAVGWREQTLAEEARELLALGQELHERAAVAFGHAAKLGDSIRMAVERYNKFVGSYDSRLLPTLRRFEDTGVSSAKDLPALPEVNVRPRLQPGETTDA